MEEIDPKINKLRAMKTLQDEIQLNYTKNEKRNHQIPDDYRDFLQRNDSILASKDTPITDSLYYWVHHSCALFTNGPHVTPKTPVKMGKLDF
jgi:hypothetical protein